MYKSVHIHAHVCVCKTSFSYHILWNKLHYPVLQRGKLRLFHQACFDLILYASILKSYEGEIKQSLP